VNIFLNLGLGLGWFGLPRMEARGLALAVFAASLAGAAFNLYCLRRAGLLSRLAFAPARWQKKAAGYLAKVALPAGGMQFSWQFGYIMLLSLTAGIPWDSVHTLAGMNTGLRVEAILFLPAFAFSSTGAVLVGRCLGAGQKNEARKTGLRVLAAGCAAMSALALCLWPFVDELAAFMAPDPAVQIHVVRYMLFNLVSTPFGVASMILGGILGGAGATLYTFVVFSVSIWLIRLPLAWYMGYKVWESSSGIFLAMPVSQCAQAAAILLVFLKCDWTRFALKNSLHK
jgi:MATE family multidrug resistance protein